MRKLSFFNLVTLDGYISGPDGDIAWHRVDKEFQKFAEKNSNSGRQSKRPGRNQLSSSAGFRGSGKNSEDPSGSALRRQH